MVECLQGKLDIFVQNVKIDRVLPALCSKRVITVRELEEYRANVSDAAEKIFVNLMRGTYDNLKKAKAILIDDNQEMVANLIPDV